MTEFFKSSDNQEAEYSFSDFQKAMEDTVVIAAAFDAKRRADNINNGNDSMVPETIQRHLLELDQMVSHVLNGGVTVSGKMQKCEDGDSSEFFMVSEVVGVFEGFVASYREDKVSFDYVLSTPINEVTGEIFTIEAIEKASDNEEGIRYSSQRVQAIPGEVFMEFEHMHPVQARAILETAYPDTLRDLGERIIHTGDNRDELAVLGLRGFSVEADNEMFKHDNSEYIKAISCYVIGMVTIDSHVPYLLNINGGYIEVSQNEKKEFQTKTINGQLMTVNGFGLYTFPKTEDAIASDISFGFTGVLHSEDADIPSPTVLIPLDSIAQIRSLRRLVSEVFPSVEDTL
jgi:hypothetical protein